MRRTPAPRDLADTIEVALLTRQVPRDKQDLAELLLGNSSARTVAAVEDAVSRMSGRRAALDERYPFGAGGDSVLVPSDDAESTVYIALLLVSRTGSTQGSVERANEVLDALAIPALEGLLGGSSVDVVPFAWPPRLAIDDVPRPEEFGNAVRWLGGRLGLAVGQGYRPPARKDGGVDLVAVRKLIGSAMGAPLVLAQTTVSRDVRSKSRDVDVGLWRTWLDLGSRTSVALIVPHELDTAQVEELHASGLIALDRPRACSLVPRDRPDLPRFQADWLTAELSRQTDGLLGR